MMADNSPSPRDKKEPRSGSGNAQRDPFTRAWDTLKSMRFAIILLLVITALTVVNLFANEFIVSVQGGQAGMAYSTYNEAYGEPRASILTFLQMYKPYSSWWYTSLLGLLTLSLLVCIIDRAPLVWKLLTGSRFLASPSQYTAGRAHSATLTGGGDLKEKTLAAIKGAGFRVKTRDTGKATLVHGQKQAIAHAGAWIVHIGFILLVIGGALIARGEFRHMVQALPGEFLSSPEMSTERMDQMLGFTVRVDDFQIHYYDLREGQYVAVDGGAKVGRILSENKDGSFNIEVLWPNRGAENNVPAERLSNRIDRRFGGNRLDQSNISDYVATLTVFENGVEQYTEDIEVNDPLRHNGYRFYQSSFSDRRTDDQGRWTTFIEVRRDSGSPLIWAGIIIVTVGLLLSLYLAPRDLWARIEEGEDGTTVYFAGNSKGRASEFEHQFQSITARIDPSRAGDAGEKA